MENITEIKDYMLKSININDWNTRREVVKQTNKDNPNLDKLLGIIDGTKLIKKCNF